MLLITDLVNQIDDAIALILVSMLASKVRDISTRKIRHPSTSQKRLCFNKRLPKNVSVKVFL